MNIILNENKLRKIVYEAIQKILCENTECEEKYVNWEEVVPYWNYGMEFVEKNERKSDKMGIPRDCRCELCQKPLSKGYKTLYYKVPSESEIDDRGSSSRYYLNQVPGSIPVKIGNTCFKAFANAFQDTYPE